MSEKKNRLAVNATDAAVLKNNWFFREQTVSDQGIDAHVEKFELVDGKQGQDEVGTGRLLALQIKGGPSYFEEPSPNGWWFRFKERKCKLWLGHALPVLVVLVDLDDGQLYWQRVTPATVQKAGKSFKIEIPRTQTVAGSDTQWTEIASGLEAHAAARFDFSLLCLPPSVAKALGQRSEDEHAHAALLAMHLAEGRNNPTGTVRALLDSAPTWITGNATWAWAVIANYCSAHNLQQLGGRAYLLAAAAVDEDERRSRLLVSAAVHLRGDEQDLAVATLEQARAIQAPDPIFLAVGNTIFSTEPDDVGPWKLDPLLLRASEEVAKSIPAQRVLARQARRAGDLDAAVEHARAALAIDVTDTVSLEQLAEFLLTRWGLEGARTTDLTESISLLEKMIGLSRLWSGPTRSERDRLATAYAMSGRWEATLTLALPPPHGTADPADLDPDLLRSAAFAARALGRLDVRDAACELLGTSVRDQLMRVRVEAILLSSEEVNALRLRELDEAIAEERYDDIARACVTLGSEGIDTTDRVQPFVERGIIPAGVPNLATALVLARANLDDALPTLRELAKGDPPAAEHLIALLREAGRHREAADAAQNLYDVTGSELYLVHRAESLIDAGAGDEAVAAAKEAVGRNVVRPVEQGRLLTFLGGTAADKQEWAEAEAYLSQVLDLFDRPDDGAVWRVVICLVNQGRIKKAASLISSYRPEVRSKEEAEIWLRAHATLRWNERIAVEAYALAKRFEDPELSTALLGHIVTNTHGVSDPATPGENQTQDGVSVVELEELDDDDLDARRRLAQGEVPGSLHAQAFALIERLVELHGDATGVRVIKGETPEEMVDTVVETLKAGAERDRIVSELVPMIRDSRIPVGFLAGVYRRGYATLLLQRAMGVLVASSPDDAEHEAEVQTASEAFAGEVAVDAATVLTLTGLQDPAALAGRFSSMATPPAAMHGFHRASFDVRGLAGSPGTFRWDEELERVVVSDLSEDEYVRLYRRTEKVEDYAERLKVLSVTTRTLLGELDIDREHAEWADVLHLAAEHELTIWSDDLGLRRLARSAGLRAFGTPAVIDAIRDLRLEQSDDTLEDQAAIQRAHELHMELAEDMVVDLPLERESLIELARRDGWIPRAAAAVISRPAWWVNNPDGMSTVQAIYDEAGAAAPAHLHGWQFAAMYGVARAIDPDTSPGLLALIALAGFTEQEASDEVRIEGMHRARQVAADLGHSDPVSSLQVAARALQRDGRCSDPKAVVSRLLEALGGGGYKGTEPPDETA